MTRSIDCSYQDPLSEIWLGTANTIGLRIERSMEAFASTDGDGTLRVSDQAGMDQDDCLAQMIFHEICHFLVSGPESMGWVDWGLDNESDRDQVFEHACLRLQAAWLEPYGLRAVLAPTTDFRNYYDALPADPFAEGAESEREAVVRARVAYGRRHRRPLEHHVEAALAATGVIARAAAPFAPRASLFSRVAPEAPRHRVGFPLRPAGLPPQPARPANAGGPVDEESMPRCGTCAWARRQGPGRAVLRCVQAELARVSPELLACERYEAELDCLSCGACCREAYDTVEVGPRDPVRQRHPELLVERSGGSDLKREGGRCACLLGGRAVRQLLPAIGGKHPAAETRPAPPLYVPTSEPFLCTIYDDRPQTCRDFTLGSQNCLDARRRVGLSR